MTRGKKRQVFSKMKCPPLCMDISFFKPPPPRPPTPSEHILHLVTRLATTLKQLVLTSSENGSPFRI